MNLPENDAALFWLGIVLLLAFAMVILLFATGVLGMDASNCNGV